MLKLEYTTPHKGKVGTIYFDRLPMSLGAYADVDGVRWDIRAILGGGDGFRYVQARIEDDAPIYRTDTSSFFQSYFLTWKPYIARLKDWSPGTHDDGHDDHAHDESAPPER